MARRNSMIPQELEDALAKARLRERRKKAATALPKGWRWLRLGEWVRIGDYCCDPRTKPVRVIVPRAWQMAPACHPVRRKLNPKGKQL